jgi:hypothetical protein
MSAFNSVESHPSVFGELTESVKSLRSQPYRPVSPVLHCDEHGNWSVQPKLEEPIYRSPTPSAISDTSDHNSEYTIVGAFPS